MSLCECGCGEETRVHRGRSNRFIHNHHARKSPIEYVVNPENGCWVWQRGRTGDGYGHIGGGRTGQQSRRAHTVFYERAYGPVPDGLELDHLCRNRACVNPDHLEAVTHTENCRRGSAVKLSLDIAREIRDRHAAGESQSALGRAFAVSQVMVGHIVHNRTWVEHAP